MSHFHYFYLLKYRYVSFYNFICFLYKLLLIFSPFLSQSHFLYLLFILKAHTTNVTFPHCQTQQLITRFNHATCLITKQYFLQATTQYPSYFLCKSHVLIIHHTQYVERSTISYKISPKYYQ
jgi:hypothetical protein